MDDIKRNLKEAREHIERKEFEDAIKLIRNVLKKDKSNYMALVLLGVALQDDEQVPFAYKKAISVNRDKPLAWQGLASYYERNNIVCDELMEAYVVLASMETDIKKYEVIHNKMVEYFKNTNDCFKHLNALYEHVKNLDTIGKKDVCLQTIVNLVHKSTTIYNLNCCELLVKLFEVNKECGNEIFNDFFFEYIITMRGSEIFQREYMPSFLSLGTKRAADAILRAYIVEYVKGDKFTNLEGREERNKFVSTMLQNSQQSIYCVLVEALVMFDQSEYYEAYCKVAHLTFNDNIKLPHCIVTGNICLKLRRWQEAERISAVSNDEFDRMLSKILFISLCYQNSLEKFKKVLEILKKIENSMDHDESIALFLAYYHLKDTNNCEKWLAKLQNVSEYEWLKCLMLKIKNTDDDELYVKCLNGSAGLSPGCWLLLGQHYMDTEQCGKALNPLLQAARHDKHNSTIFRYLGDYYTKFDRDLEKAKKCYLKAFSLNPECHKAGKSLSNTYRSLKDWNANYEFLKQLSSSQSTDSVWTWLELGLHHFGLEEWDAAIVNLRMYVRLKPSDVEAWESLADAYYSRGSFTSALKCYQRSIELNPRKYSVVQIGAVECLLGDLQAALTTFNSVNDNVFLPALKGLSDVYLSIANEKLSHNLYASCRDNIQKSVHFLTKALLNNSHFISLWTSLASAIAILTQLPGKYRWLQIDTKLWDNQSDPKEMLKDQDLFLLEIQCLCRAINLSKEVNVALYYELAAVYLDYYKLYGKMSAIQKAFVTIKYCVSVEKDNWQFWNLLGVVCTSKEMKKYALAQHAFLKAIQLEPCSALAWSNLGVVYLFFGNILLSNKAFQKAQQFDPLFVQSWIGHALIAESIDHHDAMGLFLHSAQLGFHRESCLGYAEYVCNNLVNKDKQDTAKLEYSMKNMHAVPIAHDLVTWLAEHQSEDAHCLNILGILQEKMGLLQSACKSYNMAVEHVEASHKDTLLINYGRALYLSGQYEEAAKTFKSLKEENMASWCGLALCLNKLGMYQEAYTSYGTVFQWLASDDFEKAQLLITLALMSYKNSDIDNAKTLIYQCVEEESLFACIPVMLAGYGLSVLTGDKNLYQAIIYNLLKSNENHKYAKYLTLFQSYNLLKNESAGKAICKLESHIHTSPSDANMWYHLANYCAADFSNPVAASVCAQKVISLGNCGSDLYQSYKIVSVAEARLGNKSKALKFAQKAVHLYPDRASSWLLLAFASLLNKVPVVQKQWVIVIFEFIRSSATCSKSQTTWLEYVDRHLSALL